MDRLLLDLSRLFVFILGSIAIICDGVLADCLSIVTLGIWLYLPKLVHLEKLLLSRLR
jgi:hypothetical protein